MNTTQIPAPRVPFIDQRTGLMSREWYRFFINIYTLAGGGQSDISITDLAIQPQFPTDSDPQIDPLAFCAPSPSAGSSIVLTGDVTGSGTTTIPTTLASIIAAGGPTGSATATPVITYDAKGRLTAVTSATVTPAVGSITGLGSNVDTWLATPSSANLAAALTDEMGSGSAVFGAASTWTPTRNGFTEVLGGGSITNTGNYIRIGNLVFWTCKLACAGGATLAASVGVGSYISGLPVSAAEEAPGNWDNISTAATSGGLYVSGTSAFITTAWSAASNTWMLSGVYMV